MEDSLYRLEDEAFPSFLCKSMDSTSAHATLGNVTLGSGPGLPVAASTVAKIRPGTDNRWELAAALDRSEEGNVQSEEMDSDHFSGSNSSFLANEQLMSVDSINSDITDEDIDLNNLPDDELELYFNKLVPPAMQRGRVEGQEIPATGDFQMPDVRLAATGMDSCPASDEDTEDELESARKNSSATRTRLLTSASRQLVGESNRPSFRPGLEGGSSDDESLGGHGGPSLSGIEHRRSAEGQVINPPVTDFFCSFVQLLYFSIQSVLDLLLDLLDVLQMGDRVGPVGTGKTSFSLGSSLGTQCLPPENWSIALGRQEALVSTDAWQLANHGVVYQDEEGQWVTDLAYYSSFEKEVDKKTSKNDVHFQTENFVSAGDALEKIIKDQEVFEKEHQFMQEEKIEPAGSNSTFQIESSWKVPSNNHVLMRASQVSSEFRQEDQSYLRLSLGQFFEQRSEALGCLGSTDRVDGVKRVSEATLLGFRTAMSVHSEHSDSESGLGIQSCMPPDNNSSHVMLSISTIASAIADASISTDPSQLAAMIMELSKKSRAKNHPASAGPVGTTASSTEEPHSVQDVSTLLLGIIMNLYVDVPNMYFLGIPKGFSETCVEETQCNFRPSTSPLTHSSPSQTTIPSAECMQSPPSSGGGVEDKHPSLDLSPQSACSSPGLSRLTYISMNDGTVIPTLDQQRYCFPGSFIHNLLSSSGQVVVPEELRFPHACCVGIASQTSLSLYNPSERWQQVSITVTSLAIDGEKVDSLPYQWLIVKNKTIIGPKSTEEQKVLLIPPQAGVYQCVLSVCSWPASAETEVAARANIFVKKVVVVAIAENPAIEVEVSKSGCLDFGDIPGGGAKSLSVKLLNRTHATVPIRLVISANATAWRCFSFSKHPVTVTPEALQQVGPLTPVSSPSVMNHVMHSSYGEDPESFMVWVQFKAPQKYTSLSGDLDPADEYIARVDIEVDSPGPCHVIRSIPLRARSGTARVHAPKDLQVVKALYGYVDAEDSFSVTPEELFLSVGEEQGIIVSFKTHSNRKHRESLLTILVLPSGPQYEVTLKGEVVTEDSGKPAISSAAVGPGLANNVPPILSNKQFVAWGGVTLGRAVQQKLVLRNNSTSTTQQLRLLIRGQDQDCFQLQSMFSPEERLTRHGELSIRPREDVTVHLLFAPTRVACLHCFIHSHLQIPLKQTDGYVATLTNISVGHVSKVCLCVRNTGSRAAFIKAVCFSDVQTRSVLDPSVISLAPSEFVLKERTQEVITVLMRSTQREQRLCQSASALLATVCLFCGDEISRQQYRRLLQNKPEAVHKALSENSLLKNIDFNETFLGEESVTESKTAFQAFSTFCYVLDGPAITSQIQIQNNTSRELSFDVSWPAHCLTITPQHGVIEPQRHLQILISPNPSLATKSGLLPWSGQIYVQCDGQQKFIKVQIRQDLALDVSAAPGDKTLSVLPPQAATPVLPLAKLMPNPSVGPQTPQAQVEISSKTIIFPTTSSGGRSEAQLQVHNGEVAVRWYLSSFAPPYVKGVDNTGDVYRATYTAFRCSRVSGTLGAHEKMQVPVTFLPRDRGDYAQFWDLECHPVSDPQQKTRIRFQLCVEGPQEGDCSLVKTEATVKTRKRADASGGKTSQEEAVRRGVYSPQDGYTFPATRVGESSSLKVNIRNNSSDLHELKFVSPREPFHIKHSKYSLRSQHYLKLPVQFKPSTAGMHTGLLLIQSETSGSLVIQLIGEALS
uniref:Centrosomal protein 192 n=1 Tax=Mastacembelus armatus TaxID=205130 RepID=A0A7N8XJ61_9TELE